jgi:hypothetical protein
MLMGSVGYPAPSLASALHFAQVKCGFGKAAYRVRVRVIRVRVRVRERALHFAQVKCELHTRETCYWITRVKSEHHAYTTSDGLVGLRVGLGLRSTMHTPHQTDWFELHKGCGLVDLC